MQTSSVSNKSDSQACSDKSTPLAGNGGFMRKYLVVHPFLFACYPVLHLYSRNTDEASVEDLFYVLGVVTGLSAIVFAALILFIRHVRKAALLTTVALVVVFMYGPLSEFLFRLVHGRTLFGTPLDVVLSIAVVSLPATFLFGKIVGSRKPLKIPTTYLNYLAAIVVTMPLLTVGYQKVIPSSGERMMRDMQAMRAQTSASSDRRDIFYIVMDGYAREDTLREIYGYDNSKFLDELRKRGFFVADRSVSNYAQTTLSLSCTLNLNYLDKLGMPIGERGEDRKPLGDAIRNNEVVRFLKEQGYTFVAFSSGIQRTEFPGADVYLKPDKASSQFRDVLLGMTPLPTKARYDSSRERTLYILNELGNVPETGSPRFVFAHVLAPHPPFVFAADGSPIQPKRKYTLSDGDRFLAAGGTKEEYMRDYPSQLRYVSSRLLDAVDRILAQSPDAIIIVHADHGPGSGLSTKDIAKTNLKERHRILNACRFPDGGNKFLYPEITPVNTFRIVFNYYFGTSYDLLPDRAYFSIYPHPYILTDVTATVRGTWRAWPKLNTAQG